MEGRTREERTRGTDVINLREGVEQKGLRWIKRVFIEM